MSSFLFAVPDELAAASSSLTSLGSSIREARVAAAGSTTSIVAAAEDEVSAAVARLFGGYAQQFQALGAQASLFHDQFVQALNGGGFLYAATEAASASPLQAAASAAAGVQDAINTPVQQFTGRPLFGPGTNGAPGTGQAGGPGGWLWGNGAAQPAGAAPAAVTGAARGTSGPEESAGAAGPGDATGAALTAITAGAGRGKQRARGALRAGATHAAVPADTAAPAASEQPERAATDATDPAGAAMAARRARRGHRVGGGVIAGAALPTGTTGTGGSTQLIAGAAGPAVTTHAGRRGGRTGRTQPRHHAAPAASRDQQVDRAIPPGAHCVAETPAVKPKSAIGTSMVVLVCVIAGTSLS
ncbi:PE family protein [Mycobacterium kansasii]|uniref:PE family protein n=1 Tax=Mycobacterium kansasii TaxID=1768 RepID=UPI000CDD9EC5|nr:PE family protein [Mycobacterium kansasii]POY09312.1 PE family protein [Mycobacterium kansasii]